MPKSKVRKKNDAPARLAPTTPSASGPAGRDLTPSPSWYPIVMSAVLIIGLIYIVVWYFVPDNPVMTSLGAWNLAVGFAIMVLGLIMAVRWR